jgi:hypothetical protein
VCAQGVVYEHLHGSKSAAPVIISGRVLNFFVIVDANANEQRVKFVGVGVPLESSEVCV